MRNEESPVSEASTMAMAGALLFGAGAALSLVALILPHHPGPDPLSDTITSLVAALLAGVLWRFGRRAPMWFFHAMVQTGNLLIAVGMFTGGPARTTEHYAFLYLWGALYAFYFFSRRAALLHMAAGALGYAGVLLVKESNVLWISKWFVMMGSFAVVGLIVSWLTHRIRSLARYDSLTGLFNRRTFEDELGRQVARPQPGAQLCVLLMDLDNFKSVNDTLGHQAGDRFLKEVTARWAEQLRSHDVLARYGGDEFAAVLPRCSVDAGTEVADRLRAAVPGGHTCSVGLAQWNGVEGSDELQRRADEALYRAKEAGRNCVASASDGAVPLTLARFAASTEAQT